MEIDDALLHLGSVGKWQITNFLLFAGMNTIHCFHIMAIVFIGYQPPYECKLDSTSINPNQQTSCKIFINSSNQSSSCHHGWSFPNFTGSTIVTEWGLLCDKDYLPSLSQTLLVVGFMLGSLIFTRLIDQFGRKKLNLICTLSIGFVGSINAFLPNIYLFSVFRFITGFFLPGLLFSCYVLLCETFPLHQRIFVGVFFHALWSIASLVQPMLSYFITNWRYFQLTISLYSFLFLPFQHLIRESILWDIANGRIKNAEETLRIAAKRNGITFNEPILKETEIILSVSSVDCKTNENNFKNSKTVLPDEQQSSLSVLIGNSTMFFYLFSAVFLLTVNGCIFFGLSFSTGVLPGNRFSNAFLTAFAEIPSHILTYLTLKYFGRKKTIQAFHVLCALSLWLTAYFTIQETDDLAVKYSSMFLNFSSKFFINASYAIVMLYSSEIFPVNLRATALGIGIFVSKIGTLFSVYGAFLTEKYGRYVFTFYGALSLGVAILMVFLPETHKKPLPNTVQEACDLRKTRKISVNNG